MPEYRRANVRGGTYFFTVNTYRRQPILTEEPVRLALREGIQLARAHFPFEILAWVLLPDHLHCIWKLPDSDAEFAKRWGIIKRHVSSRCAVEFNDEAWLSPSRRKRSETSLWQRRYWEHCIRDDEDFTRHVEYLHWNPVKHGLAKRVADWPYSTFHRYVARGIYPADWGGDFRDSGKEGEFGE